MTEKKVFFILIIFSLLFISCKAKRAKSILDNAQNNLKITAVRKNENTQWTQELERGRLNQNINSNDYISQGIKLTPEVLIAHEAGMNKDNIYPIIDGFASLDISDLNPEAVKLIDSFCDGYTKQEELDGFMAEGCGYALSLFLFDCTEAGFDNSNLNWLIGKAFVSDNCIGVPVRLNNGSRFVDVRFYLKDIVQKSKSDENDADFASEYKILDLEIFNYGDEKNGK